MPIVRPDGAVTDLRHTGLRRGSKAPTTTEARSFGLLSQWLQSKPGGLEVSFERDPSGGGERRFFLMLTSGVAASEVR